MKKKLALFLSVLSCLMLLGACGSADPTAVDYNGVTYEQLYQQSYSVGTALAGVSAGEIQEQAAYLEANYADEATLDIELCNKWLEAMEVSGDFVKVADDGFTVTKSGKTLTTDLVLVFEERDVVFQLVYNYINMELTGVTVEPVYTMGEKMVKAGLNTLICMSIVFFVLIFISLLISCFKIFPYLEAKKKEKALKNMETDKKEDVVVTQVQPAEEALTDDTELVAVIAAAIASYEGTSTSDFVVRSIRRR